MRRKQTFAFMASSRAGNFSIGFTALLSLALVLPAWSFQDTAALAKQTLQAESDVTEASSSDRARKLMRTEAPLGADGDSEPARHHHNWAVGASGELIAQSVKRNIDADMKVFTHGPSKGHRSALHYFQQWSKGAIDAALRRGEVGPASLIHRDGGHWNAQCSGSHQDEWQLLDTVEDTHVHHQLFRTSARKLQYIAAQKDSDAHTVKVLFADPPVCHLAREGTSLEERDAPLDDSANLLDPNDDSAQDCKALFHRTAQENCGKYYSITVLRATEEIIDGLEIDMLAEVAGFHHRVKCAFEVGQEAAVASGVPVDEELSEEKNGMTATLIMSSDMCKADTESSVTDLDAENAQLLEAHPLGELSFYKGYEHINDDMPQVLVEVNVSNLALSFEWVTEYPNCFPGVNGVGVVRNQGKCGSCWAFAAATSVMHTLCIDAQKKGDTVSANEATYKASVQKLLSCNKDERGCKGGSAFTADSAFTLHGIAKEVDAPYMCGAGDSLKHFETANNDPCPKFPWGAECEPSKANTAWTYGNAKWLTSPGEAKMMQMVVDGNGVYASFIVWGNFLKYKKGIYDKASGKKSGGHAAALVGYGSEGGVKYWRIQNSWGEIWGENGFFRFLRGEDLCDIEKRQPVRYTAWAGAVPAPPPPPPPAVIAAPPPPAVIADKNKDKGKAKGKGKANKGGTACVWSTWSDWSECTYSCGTGDEIRNRTVKVAATNGGTQCPGPFEETRGCNMDACPVAQNAEGEETLNKSGNETNTTATKAGDTSGFTWLMIGGSVIFFLVMCGGMVYAYAQDQSGKGFSGKKDLDDWGEEAAGEEEDDEYYG